MSRERWRLLIVGGGGVLSLLFAFGSLAMMFYWHHVSGTWVDSRILNLNPYPIVGIAGVFFFTRIVDSFFED